MVDPIITPIVALKVALGHAAFAKLVLIYKGLIASAAHGHVLGSIVQGAVNTAQTIGVVGALQMVAQMLIIMGTVAAGSQAAESALKALKRMAEGNHEKALKHGKKALDQAGPVLKVWRPSPSGW
jgi:hypothetical protein